MAAQGNTALRIGIQLVLAVVIAVGVYYLYLTITEPWEEYEAQQLQTTLTRARMDHVRTALIEYRDQNQRYPGSLDSLVAFVKTDSVYQGRDLADIFPLPDARAFQPDSLPYSPRTGNPFVYDVVSNDSTGVSIYYLQDPDVPEDYIGAREPDPARRNAASWE